MADQGALDADDRQEMSTERPAPFAEPTIALSESNHRIANNLSLLASAVSMRAAAIRRRHAAMDSDDVATLLDEVCARISTIGNLHRFLSIRPGAGRIDLNKHLHELCKTLVAALSEAGETELIETSAGECVVWTKDVLPLCLIVTEVVTNSLKYAHPSGVAGKLMIGCRREDDDTVVIEVGDDGVGLPDGFDLGTGGGIGFRTIRVLAKQLGAEYAFESSPIGLRFQLRVPAPD